MIYIKTLKDMTPDPELGNKTPLYVVSIPDIQLSMVQAMAPLDGKIRRTWIGTGYMIPFYERDHLGPTVSLWKRWATWAASREALLEAYCIFRLKFRH